MITLDLRDIIVEGNEDYTIEFDIDQFPFKRFYLLYTDNYYGRGKNNTISTEVIITDKYDEYDDRIILLNRFYDADERKPMNYEMYIGWDESVGSNGGNYGRGCVIAYLMNYVMNEINKRDIQEIYTTHKEKTSQQVVKHRDYKTKKYFLLSDIKKYFYIDANITKHKEIQCPCWSVRGHYRHYKSGKVVFIKEYNKGKKRDTEQPKEKCYGL